MSPFKVKAVPPRLWSGRYRRIPANSAAFHLRHSGTRWWPVVDWDCDSETAECPMRSSAGAIALASSVNAGKRFLNGNKGGSFLITEYGLILVPASRPGDTRVAVVGECSGPLEFTDNMSGNGTFDLADDHGLSAGAAWGRPYVGVLYHLSKRSELYFWHETADGAGKCLPAAQDRELINKLRSLRASGAVRLVAAYGGFVLTRVPVGNWQNPRWESRYVGRINFKQWFPKEKLR